MNLQQQVIAYAMFNDDKNAAVSYTLKGNIKYHDKKLTSSELPSLVLNFKQKPQKLIRSAVECLDEIKKDAQSSESRLLRYFGEYQHLLVGLDKSAFERSDTKLYQGVPTYIPDGFSDMGSDSTLNPQFRNREKQYVNKANIFEGSGDFFEKMIRKSDPLLSSSTVFDVARHVFEQMPYDHKNRGIKMPCGSPFGGSVPLTKYVNPDEPNAVCRNQALYAQVLLQTLGIDSQLLKCDVDFGKGKKSAHVANLIQGKNDWYLLDVTNPIMKGGAPAFGIVPIEDTNIDTNTKNYQWDMSTDSGDRVYTSRNNMFYRVK